jgi:hypothetical protein
MRILSIVLIVGLLAGCSANSTQHTLDFAAVELSGGNNNDPTTATPRPTQSEDPAESNYVVDRSAEIDIEDQLGSGEYVQIEEIRVGRSNTFLVIYNSAGTVLASQLVSPQSQPVNVRLERALSESGRLEAVLYLDDGDGVFEIIQDFPLIDDDGDLVHEDFDYTLTGTG